MCHCIQHFWLVFRTLAGFALYIADFVTDVILAAEYYSNGHYYWFGFTLGFALVPQTIVNFVLMYLDQDRWKWYLLPIGVPANYFQVLYAFFCCKHHPEDVLDAREKEDHDDQEPVPRAVNHLLPLARLVGTLLESLPELCLQIYVLLQTGQLSNLGTHRLENVTMATVTMTALRTGQLSNLGTHPMENVTVATVTMATVKSSLEIPPLKAVTMGFSFVASLYSIIEWETHFPNINNIMVLAWGTLVFFWKIVDLSARILAFSLFAYIYRYWVFVVVALHWLVMWLVENVFCRYFREGNGWIETGADVISDSNRCVQFMFNTFVVAPVDVFTWVTFGSRLLSIVQPIVNSLLMLLTNIVMVSVWYSARDGSWYDGPFLGWVLGWSVASAILQGVYWLCYTGSSCSPLEDV
uniref:XK-related protein n=1 Tax=Branchiostoma floridae TaxID=7739 RepID=C3XXH7_BRAFL|eukprot:XP_002611427.1 hypothetical protein BRAFLDRAFT_63942 [Branchiostoma floridae]